MTDAEDRLATIFGNAVNFGDLDPKYSEDMHAEVWAVLDELQQVNHVLSGELVVTRAEVAALTDQRNATRVYLGVALSFDDDADGTLSPREALRREVQRILHMVGRDKKIQCIKELRSSEAAQKAWVAMSNGPAQTLNGNVMLGLKEAKDIIDYACKGILYCGTGGTIPL